MDSFRSKIGLQFVVSNGAMLAHFGLSIALSRVLTPAEIGIFSITAVFVGFTQVFRDFGVVSYIQRQKTLTPEVLSAATGVLFTSSWIIAALLYFSADIWSLFFKQPGIREIMPILALGFVFIPFGSIPLAVLGREMEVKKTTLITALATTVYITTCIVLALQGFSYMSMAWANLASIVTSGIALTLMMPKGLTLRPSFKGWKTVAQFGAGAMVASSVKAIDTALPDIFLGKLSGPHGVGIFSRGNSTVNIFNSISGPTINYFALPYLSRAHHGGKDLSEEVGRTIAYLTGIMWPALVVIGMLSNDIILFLYGETWIESAELVPWLCLVGAIQVMFAIVQPALTALGKPYLSALPVALVLILKITVALLLFNETLVSFVKAIAFAEVVSVPVYIFIVRKYIGMRLAQWRVAIGKSAVLSLAILVLTVLLGVLFGHIASPMTSIATAALILIPGWVIGIVFTKHPILAEFKQVAGAVWSKFHHRSLTPSDLASTSNRYEVVIYGAVTHAPPQGSLIQQLKAKLKLGLKLQRDVLRWRLGSLEKLDYRAYVTTSSVNRGDQAIAEASRRSFLKGRTDLTFLNCDWEDRSEFKNVHGQQSERIIAVCGSGYISFGQDGQLARRLKDDLVALQAIQTPVVLYGIGVNRHLDHGSETIPLAISESDRETLVSLLERCSHISVRDRSSKEVLSQFTGKAISLVGDPAFYYSAAGNAPGKTTAGKQVGRPRIGVNFPFHGAALNSNIRQNLPGYVDLLKAIQGATQCEFVYMVHFEPELVVAKMIASAGIPLEIVAGDPETLCQTYASLNIHIGGMLHSCILAASAGTPSVALAYDIKHAGFFDLLGMQSYCLSATPFNSSLVAAAAIRALADEPQLRAAIHARRQVYEKEFNLFTARCLALLDITLKVQQAPLNSLDVPRVSVIIPVRNLRHFIQEAIDSVLYQGFTHFEIIVIDDGSNDFDYRTLAQQDPRIRVIRLAGRGVSHARNAGMRMARGEFFAFLDADDVWSPGKLQAQIAYFDAHPDVGVVYGAHVKWLASPGGSFTKSSSLLSDCSQVTRSDPLRSGWVYLRLIMGLLIGMNTAVIRRDVYRSIGGFNESMRWGEDYDYWLRASRISEMHSLAATVALYRIHATNSMNSLPSENQLALLLQSAYSRWGSRNPDGNSLSNREFQRRIADTHFDHGYSHFWKGGTEIAKTAFRHALFRGSKRGRSLIYLLMANLTSLRNFVGGRS